MARDEDAGHFEWVNAWATTTSAPAIDAPAKTAAAAAPPPAAPRYTVTGAAEATTIAPEIEGDAAAPGASTAVAPPPDQLMRDIAEIERARDALAGGAIGQRMRAFMLVPSRTADATPLMIGGILALAMLTVFGAAAAVSKFSAR